MVYKYENFNLNKKFWYINTNNGIPAPIYKMLPPCPRCGKDDFKKTRDRDAYLNRKFLCKPSNIQNPIVAPIPLSQNSATDQIPIQNHVPVDDLILLNDTPLLPIQNMPSNNHLQNDTEWFDNMENKYNINADKKWSELDGTLLYDYPKKNHNCKGNFGGKPVRKNYK